MPLDDLGNVINPFADASSEASSALNNFVLNSLDNLDLTLPQGYLVHLFFDKDMNLVNEYSGVQRVETASSLQKLAVMNQKMPSDGFYYTYVTNQSAQLTQFDNLTYIHIEGVLKEATDYYPYGLLCSSATIASVNTINNYKFQDKEFNRKEFVNTWGLDSYNHGARMYDPELGRWHVQDPALQFANPYLAMGNNPVSMTDPDGQFIGTFLTGIAQAVKTTLQTGWNFGEALLSSDREGWDNFSNEWKNDMRNFDPTLEGTVNNNAIRIDMGMFKTDPNNKNGWQDAGEILSRFTWQAPQTALGLGWNHANNNFGRVESVEYFHGATFVVGAARGGNAVTLGSYISISPVSEDDQANIEISQYGYSTMHEYGHYIQSKKSGPLYLLKYGIPSARGAKWTETDANTRAARYFQNIDHNFTWQDNGTTYRKLSTEIYNPRWWEFGLLSTPVGIPYIIFKNWKKPW